MDKLHVVKVYIFEYVTGVLWVLASIVVTTDLSMLSSAVRVASESIKALPAVHVPDLAVGFVIAIAGITVPYAVAMALSPLSIVLSNVLLGLTRRKKKNFCSFSEDATAILYRHGSGDVGNPEILAYLSVRVTNLATPLEEVRNEVVFRANAALPSALLFAGLAYHASSSHALLWAGFIGVSLYTLAMFYSIRELNRWTRRVSAVIVFSDSGADNDQGVTSYIQSKL